MVQSDVPARETEREREREREREKGSERVRGGSGRGGCVLETWERRG